MTSLSATSPRMVTPPLSGQPVPNIQPDPPLARLRRRGNGPYHCYVGKGANSQWSTGKEGLLHSLTHLPELFPPCVPVLSLCAWKRGQSQTETRKPTLSLSHMWLQG